MDNKLFEKGLAKRRATLGADYVDTTMDNAALEGKILHHGLAVFNDFVKNQNQKHGTMSHFHS